MAKLNSKTKQTQERLDFDALLAESYHELNEMQQRALERNSVQVLPRRERELNPVCEALKKVGLV